MHLHTFSDLTRYECWIKPSRQYFLHRSKESKSARIIRIGLAVQKLGFYFFLLFGKIDSFENIIVSFNVGYDPDSRSSDVLKISSLIQKLLGFKKKEKNLKQDFHKSTLHTKSNGK